MIGTEHCFPREPVVPPDKALMLHSRSGYDIRMIALRFCLIAMIFFAAAIPAHAADEGVPYWASIDAETANMRVGPGESYRISWVYRRQNLPVKVVRREGPWRLIEDPEGDRGWMRDLLLSRRRSAIVTGKGLAEIRAAPAADARLQWRLEPGVVGLLGDGECEDGWCQFQVGAHKGFAPANRLWGTGAP